MFRLANKTIKQSYNTVNGKKIVFLGWELKKDTNDTRELAAIYVADLLLSKQAQIAVHNPKVEANQMHGDLTDLRTHDAEESQAGVSDGKDPYEACNGHMPLPAWDEYKEYDWQRIYDNMLESVNVFDGRNTFTISSPLI